MVHASALGAPRHDHCPSKLGHLPRCKHLACWRPTPERALAIPWLWGHARSHESTERGSLRLSVLVSVLVRINTLDVVFISCIMLYHVKKRVLLHINLVVLVLYQVTFLCISGRITPHKEWRRLLTRSGGLLTRSDVLVLVLARVFVVLVCINGVFITLIIHLKNEITPTTPIQIKRLLFQ